MRLEWFEMIVKRTYKPWLIMLLIMALLKGLVFSLYNTPYASKLDNAIAMLPRVLAESMGLIIIDDSLESFLIAYYYNIGFFIIMIVFFFVVIKALNKVHLNTQRGDSPYPVDLTKTKALSIIGITIDFMIALTLLGLLMGSQIHPSLLTTSLYLTMNMNVLMVLITLGALCFACTQISSTMTHAKLSFITLLALWLAFERLLATILNAEYIAQFRIFDLSQTLTPTRLAFFIILTIMFYGITLIKARHEAPNTS